jgi:hypothetical protein
MPPKTNSPSTRKPQRRSRRNSRGERSSSIIDVIHLEMDANIAIVIARVGDRNINLEMVREGWAETYKEFLRPPYMDDLLLAEKSAKESGKGIWGQEGYVSPVDFRQQEGYKEPFIRR